MTNEVSIKLRAFLKANTRRRVPSPEGQGTVKVHEVSRLEWIAKGKSGKKTYRFSEMTHEEAERVMA